MRIEYLRTANHSYMIVKEADYIFEHYEVQMILHNEIMSLLDMRIIVGDGQVEYWYDVTGMQSLEKLFSTDSKLKVTIPSDGWAGSGPYTYTSKAFGLADRRRCIVYPAYGDDTAANLAMREACGYISYTKRDGQNITFTCLEDKPAVDINVIVEVYV